MNVFMSSARKPNEYVLSKLPLMIAISTKFSSFVLSTAPYSRTTDVGNLRKLYSLHEANRSFTKV